MSKKYYKSKIFQVVPQLEEVSQDEEVGVPLVEYFARPSEQKRAFLETIDKLSGILPGDDADDEAYNLLDDQNTNEVEDFNRAFDGSPYAVDANGVANYEKALARNKKELKEFRNYMAMKDVPEFQELASMFEGKSRNEIAKALEAMKSAGTPSDVSDGEAKSDGVPE